MSSVLVTGGAGFIGASLCTRLLDDGHRVVVVDRVPDARRGRTVAELTERAGPGMLEVVVADLADLDLPSLLRRVDAVVHLVGRPGVQTSWAEGFEDHLQENVALSQHLLEAALDAPLQTIVMASSSSVYGEAGGDGPVREDVTLRPISPYGVSKATLEMLVGTYALRGVPAVALRYFSVYGRRQRPDMAVARMVEALRDGAPFPLRGDGTQARDMTHVDDVVEATMRTLEVELRPGTVVNVGSGTPVTLSETLDAVGRLCGRPVPVVPVGAVPGDPRRTWADLGRAERLLGWQPRTGLLDGLRDQLARDGADLLAESSLSAPGRT